MHWFLCLKGFYLFPKGRNFSGGFSGEDLNRIFFSFLGVSFNILILQNEHVGSKSFFGQFHLQRMSPEEGPGLWWVCP